MIQPRGGIDDQGAVTNHRGSYDVSDPSVESGHEAEDPAPPVRVGYRNPPVHTRWQKGQSGNPKGPAPRLRPARGGPGDRLPGADEPTRAMILAEAYRTVTFTEEGVTFEMPAGQAVLRAMMVNAVRGNRIAQWRFTQIVQEAERQQKRTQEALYNVFERPAYGEPKAAVSRDDDLIYDDRTREMVVRGS
ncbi:MAG: DUF5681 domain-containing protein [Pseudomonadota bacterium]